MSTFKEIIEEDIKDVFLNLDEFADIHNLNGIDCACVIQSPTIQKKFLNGKDYDGYEGIHGEAVIVYCDKRDLSELPAEGQIFKVDGEIYQVSSCTDDKGLLKISLSANKRGMLYDFNGSD